MAVRTKRALCVSLCVLVCSIAFLAGQAVAAKCPYCGRTYPEPAPWPGEKERIKALREAHERTCPKRPKGRPEVPDKRDIQVLRAARSFPDGGGFEKSPRKGHGVPEDVKLNKGDRRPIRRANPKLGTYCCGFTFAVVMKAARNKGLLVGKPRAAAERFAREWYGATAASAEKQVPLAMENFGIGGEVQPEIKDIRHKALRPGDFVMFWRRNKSGHSVVFLDWVRAGGGKIVGIKYRSSQSGTKGIGDAVEYFESPPGKHRRRLINPRRAYAGRLHRPDTLPGAKFMSNRSRHRRPARHTALDALASPFARARLPCTQKRHARASSTAISHGGPHGQFGRLQPCACCSSDAPRAARWAASVGCAYLHTQPSMPRSAASNAQTSAPRARHSNSGSSPRKFGSSGPPAARRAFV